MSENSVSPLVEFAFYFVNNASPRNVLLTLHREVIHLIIAQSEAVTSVVRERLRQRGNTELMVNCLPIALFCLLSADRQRIEHGTHDQQFAKVRT